MSLQAPVGPSPSSAHCSPITSPPSPPTNASPVHPITHSSSNPSSAANASPVIHSSAHPPAASSKPTAQKSPSKKSPPHKTFRPAKPSTPPIPSTTSKLAPYKAHPGRPRLQSGPAAFPPSSAARRVRFSAGYDTVRYLESEKLPAPKGSPEKPWDDRNLPDLVFGLYDEIVIFDHVQKTILVVANAHIPPAGPPPAAKNGQRQSFRDVYDDAVRRVESVVQKLSAPLAFELTAIDLSREARPQFTANMSKEQYETAVLAAKEYIKAGDIFQVVLSQRLQTTTSARPFDIYRALRVINPSPFMFYLSAPECTLVGSSPEIMCRVQDGVITNRPLAGTRRRGATDAEDKALEEDLLADPKERAEHIMLVDLGRNDVGRAAELGSVAVSDVMTVERYSHVMHIVSNVTGKLAKEKTAFDAFRMALPVGTVSGAPKIRAMQIIDQLEPTKRGPYAGAVGYIDYSGNMDTCIALRTMVVTPAAGDNSTVYVQAGAGLVADSVPASEHQECFNKASALLKAVALAEQAMS